jgi:hypothetical protein
LAADAAGFHLADLAKERDLGRRVEGSSGGREDTDTRVAVGAAGLVILLIMIALVLRSRARRAMRTG